MNACWSEVAIYLGLYGFEHGFTFYRGVLPLQFFDLFLQTLYLPNVFFCEMRVGDIDQRQKTQKQQVGKISEHPLRGMVADVQCVEKFVCHFLQF